MSSSTSSSPSASGRGIPWGVRFSACPRPSAPSTAPPCATTSRACTPPGTSWSRRPATSSTTRSGTWWRRRSRTSRRTAGRSPSPRRRRCPGWPCATKAIEQCHVCLGVGGYAQQHDDRYVSYLLNIVLGGSMSSRLFQNIRERRGLAYARQQRPGVLPRRRRADHLRRPATRTRCARSSISVVAELRDLRDNLVPEEELRRAQDHLKGSLVLSLESSSSRMSHMARQQMYFGRQLTLEDTLRGVEAVTREDIRRVARDLLPPGSLSATVLGPVNGIQLGDDQLALA